MQTFFFWWQTFRDKRTCCGVLKKSRKIGVFPLGFPLSIKKGSAILRNVPFQEPRDQAHHHHHLVQKRECHFPLRIVAGARDAGNEKCKDSYPSNWWFPLRGPKPGFIPTVPPRKVLSTLRCAYRKTGRNISTASWPPWSESATLGVPSKVLNCVLFTNKNKIRCCNLHYNPFFNRVNHTNEVGRYSEKNSSLGGVGKRPVDGCPFNSSPEIGVPPKNRRSRSCLKATHTVGCVFSSLGLKQILAAAFLLVSFTARTKRDTN